MALPRESTFMPTIKCSLCNQDIEISLMGEHICQTASSTPAPAPAPAPAPDVLGGAFASLKNTVFGFGSRAAPPSVDTSAANQAYQDQLTPVSASTGSRTISPKTPTGRLGSGLNGDDFFSPAIAESTPPPNSRRPGGYGGLSEPQPYEPEPIYAGGYSSSPNQAPPAPSSLLQRINTTTPGPFEMKKVLAVKKKNAFAPPDRIDSFDVNSTDGFGVEQSDSSRNGAMAPPRVPRKNGYGGFGPPPHREQQDDENEPRPLGERSATFPKQSLNNSMSEGPSRTPSAPGLRPEPQRPNENTEPPMMTRDREKRPSFGVRDTLRPPPPRKSLVRPPTASQDGSLSINLADEFGVGNPYHSPSVSSVSQSSNGSGYSQPSTNTSPARSMGSTRRLPSNTAKFDNLMNDLSSSIDELNPKELRHAPPQQSLDTNRFDPAIQEGRVPPRARSPLPSPMAPSSASRRDPAIQGGDGRSRSPDRRPHNRNPSVGRSRGNCKACMLPITGKSISSADGRLTGRYHKACFVCSTCQEPFSSSTFYVLDDKPYCEQHYHELNGSLCGSCGVGIEGQYLEDEKSTKYHPGCFCCADCGQPLRDGYFEVSGTFGKAFCKRDAWRRMQQPPTNRQSGRDSLRPPQNGRSFGRPSGGHLAPPGLRPPRMEKRMTRLGMM